MRRRLLVAVDVNISDRDIGRLARLGHMIVCVAGEAEPDSEWLSRALSRGTEAVISQDLDIPNLLDQFREFKVMWFEKVHDFENWVNCG